MKAVGKFVAPCLWIAALLATGQGTWAADKPPPEVVRAVEEQLRASQPAPRAPVAETKGIVTWDALADVSVIKQQDRYVPQFSKQVAALDNKAVKLQGFMMPLEMGAKQKRFLLTATPPECAFCVPGSAEQFVEVLASTPVKYVLDSIVLSGRFALVRDDSGGLLYRLTDAVMVEK